jgi:hypothetical protein
MPIPGNMLPVINVEQLDEADLLEAELDENIKRADLTWQERTNALARIQQLRTRHNEGQTLVATAEEIASITGEVAGTLAGEISRATLLAEALDDPDVAGARDEREAWSIFTRKMDKELRETLGKNTRPSVHTLLHTRFQNILEASNHELPAFSCIIADPPYGMDAQDFGDAAKVAHQYEDDKTTGLQTSLDILDYSWATSAKRAHLYMFCDIDHFLTLRERAISVGWKPWRVPLIWAKGSTGHAAWGPYGILRTHELILCATKGDKPFNRLLSDVISVPNLKHRDHAAQKPVELYLEFLQRSTVPGDTVLDPCCGSGTIFPAASMCKVTAWGIESNDDYHALAQRRLEEEAN